MQAIRGYQQIGHFIEHLPTYINYLLNTTRLSPPEPTVPRYNNYLSIHGKNSKLFYNTYAATFLSNDGNYYIPRQAERPKKMVSIILIFQRAQETRSSNRGQLLT